MSESVLSLVAIGNPDMGDDGIGPALLTSIRSQLAKTIDVLFWNNKDALSIAAELLEIDNTIVIIDCADMGINGGDFRWFHKSECLLKDHFELLSTHGFGFAEAFALVEELGFNQDLYFFAIQPVHIDFGLPISKQLQNKIPLLANELLEKLKHI